MEWTPHWSRWASSDTVSCSFSYHTWQFIIFTFSTITACIISYSLSISFWTQDLALQRILSSIDLFLFFRTDYTDSRTMLNGCRGKCVRLSRSLVGFWTHFKSPHFHSFIHFISFIAHHCDHDEDDDESNTVALMVDAISTFLACLRVQTIMHPRDLNMDRTTSYGKTCTSNLSFV